MWEIPCKMKGSGESARTPTDDEDGTFLHT
jgi:hypothetical protein